MTQIDVAKIAQEAQAALDSRVAAATALATAQQVLADRQAAVAEAEVEHGEAYAQALELGWTAAELKGLGLAAPAKKPATRAKKVTRSEPINEAASEAVTEAISEPEDESPEDHDEMS